MCCFFVFSGLIVLYFFLSEHQMVKAFKLSSDTKLWQVNQKFNIYLALARPFIVVWCFASLPCLCLPRSTQEIAVLALYILGVHVGCSWCWTWFFSIKMFSAPDDRKMHSNPVIPMSLCRMIFHNARWFQGLDPILVWLAHMASVCCDVLLWRFTHKSCISACFVCYPT